MRHQLGLPLAVICIVCLVHAPHGLAQVPTQEQATGAMHRAVTFFREKCSAGGGYIYKLSADLTKREGEGKVGPTTAWIQPPGTPSVGMAYLEAWQLTGDAMLKAAALETADALVRGQLVSGGWDNMIEFDPEVRKRYAYRVDVGNDPGRRRNTTTFDDDKSQSALRYLMKLDQELKFKNARLHEAVQYALEAFLKAQYPNGAWPQRYSKFPNPADYLVEQASFPETWSREYPGKDYKSFYTLNDNTISDVIATMLDAWDIYHDERFLRSAKKGGDFFLLAQMPEPQPGWAQQYDRDMHPAWARKFEPPAITGGESQGVIQTLMTLYRRTKDERYLGPIPRAIKYYRSVMLPDGRMARFYELKTNKPLYFTKDYRLTYSDADMPTHYGFKTGSRLDRLEKEYKELLKTPTDQLWTPREKRPPLQSDALARDAKRVIDALDKRGAWVESGKLSYHGADDPTRKIIQSRTFCRNLLVLARYISALHD